ncbi:TolC family protein [uncultured Muribaculum sp.]|uniref:TolC family protein n=1 Tax=uncultured Muribaculum sp. TaxID=1918613 RepID=UPI00261E3CB5|nr:TolC family protein [uncultured Muribaculum sp.]
MNKLVIHTIASICLVLASAFGASADTLSITLDNAIIRARSHSVDAAVALNELRTAYWEYRTYRADLLPEVSFSATLPAYYKKYNTYQADNGTYNFVRNNYLQMNGELSVSQNIWFTGGRLSLNTSLDFIRQLDGDYYNRFMSIPVALTLEQPIFGVNNIKWNRRIEPVRYSEAKARFLSASEDVALSAIQHFFNLLMARENLNIARQNYDNATKLYSVAKAKREMGKISENDLLQMEINVLDAKSDITNCESTLKSNMFALRSFLAYDDNVELQPVEPSLIPQTDIVYSDALDRALSNNKFAKNLRRRQLEADYNVAKAKGNLRQISLFAQIGFTGASNEFNHAYNPLKDNQVVEIGFKIPLIDWGKRRGAVKVAESNRQVVENRLRQETQDFNQNLFILVERFNNQKMQLGIANRADQIARQRYDTNVQTYMIGKISTLDLNDSQVRKDESRQKYINELFQYWYYFYQLRSLTLWDYASGTGIDADIDRILKQ